MELLACIKNGKNWKHLSMYIDCNLFYLKQKWPDSYLPFEIVYEKIKNQDKFFRPDYFAPGNAKHYRYFLQSLNYWLICFFVNRCNRKMGRIVDREYLVSCLNQCYVEQKNNCYFCFGGHCRFCRRTEVLQHQLCVKKFNGKNVDVVLWLILYNEPNKACCVKMFFN